MVLPTTSAAEAAAVAPDAAALDARTSQSVITTPTGHPRRGHEVDCSWGRSRFDGSGGRDGPVPGGGDHGRQVLELLGEVAVIGAGAAVHDARPTPTRRPPGSGSGRRRRSGTSLRPATKGSRPRTGLPRRPDPGDAAFPDGRVGQVPAAAPSLSPRHRRRRSAAHRPRQGDIAGLAMARARARRAARARTLSRSRRSALRRAGESSDIETLDVRRPVEWTMLRPAEALGLSSIRPWRTRVCHLAARRCTGPLASSPAPPSGAPAQVRAGGRPCGTRDFAGAQVTGR